MPKNFPHRFFFGELHITRERALPEKMQGWLLAAAVATVVTGHKCQGASMYFILQVLTFTVILLGFLPAISLRRRLSLLLIDGWRATCLLVLTGIGLLVRPNGFAVLEWFLL